MSESTLFSEKEITEADAIEHGLSAEEFARIQEVLGGRVPTVTELGVYSGLWSEHCSYKNSILQLKTLPTESPRALTKTGEENAGALDIGDGLAVVFKIESHNHPTAVEPYQGAATGVGGIMRDIFTMGARPICSLNSLRFGPPLDYPGANPELTARNRYLFSGAVKGIGDYGNCLGIPVSGGEVFFDPSFSRNCLVNAMTVGVVRHEDLAFAKAAGENNPVYVVGAGTGRDGIHGASFASQDLTDESESKRSAVQVGDPFMEKLLLEATLELLATDAIVGIQDMGAAGLSCATSEMSAKGGVGMDVNLDLVPMRETAMNAYEIMLSESQERMLVCVKAGREGEVIRIFEKWELNVVKIGHVTEDGLLKVRRNGELCTAIPAESLVLGGGAPRYQREQKRPAYLDEVAKFSDDSVPESKDPAADFLKLLGSPNVCSKRPVYEQYDTEVGLARVIGPGGDGGLARVPGTNKGVAVSTDCNSRYCYLDPFTGTAQAVSEGARNVAVTGARPLGVTNCLNFGNPKIPENYYVFAECIRGMREACLAHDVPVTGGNVSFYNESEDGPVYPTPTIGMVGLIQDIKNAIPPFAREAGQALYLIGNFRPTFGGSEYLRFFHGRAEGLPPELDLAQERALVEFLCSAAESGPGLLRSAHDLSIGGLAMALFRLGYDPAARALTGARLEPAAVDALSAAAQAGRAGTAGKRRDLLFFGETNGCALITCAASRAEGVEALAAKSGVSALRLGETTAAGNGAVLDFGGWTISADEAIAKFESGLVGVL
jgi:phosphoribosylformylglycinamidine synthase II